MSESNSHKDKVRVASIQIELLGNSSFGLMLRKALADSERVSLASTWLQEDRPLKARLLSYAINRKLPSNYLAKTNLDYRRFRSELTYGYCGRCRAETMIKQHQPHIVHFNTQVPAYCSAKLPANTPIAVSLDNTAVQIAASGLTAYAFTYRPNIYLDRQVFDAAVALFPMSNWAAQSLIKDYGIDPSKVHVAYPGVETGRFTDVIEKRRTDAPRTRLLFIGNDFNRKGGPETLNVFLSEFADTCELHIVSNAAPNIDHPNVRFSSNIQAYSKEWFEMWENADIFVLPTRFDALPVVHIEAIAAGLPIIGTNINAQPEMVIDGESGLLVGTRNERELATALRYLVKNPGVRLAMGSKAHQHAKASFDVSKFTNVMESAFVNARRDSVKIGA